MALIPSGPYRGKVLVWDYQPGVIVSRQRWSIIAPDNSLPGGLRFLNRWVQMPPGEGDLFCAGLAWTQDGRLFVPGGTTEWPATLGVELTLPVPLPGFGGGRMVWVFDPTRPDNTGYSGIWAEIPAGDRMQRKRWYPTVTLDREDRLLVWGGTHYNSTSFANSYEAFVLNFNSWPPTGQWDSNDANIPHTTHKNLYQGPTGSPSALGDYPRMHGLPDGTMAFTGFEPRSAKRLHPVPPALLPSPAWDTTAGLVGAWPHPRHYGAHFVLPSPTPGASTCIVRTGGYQPIGSYGVPVEHVELCDVAVGGSQWSTWYPMWRKRSEHNAVILPDRKVLVIGGRKDDVSNYACQAIRGGSAVLTPEILSSGGWTLVAAHESPRVYHSAALLLPDARVFVGGGECRTWDYEIYDPPYLTNGKPRPTGVQVSQETLAYNAQYSVTWEEFADPQTIVERVVLMRPGAVTHHTDSEQRYIELSSQLVNSAQRTFTTPPNPAHAARGWWMLFLLTNDDVPSVAVWVFLQ